MSTYTPIASQTLGSAAASVTFSSIPQGYTDLVLVVNAGTAVATANYGLEFNADSGSNYSQTWLRGNGSAAASSRASNNTWIQVDYYGYTASITNLTTIQIQNYSNSTTNKTVLIRGDSADYGVTATVGLWRNTAPITSLKIYSSAYNLLSGSTFSLYGIQVGIASQKAQGGNIVTSDGTYVYHTFTSSGSFIPSQALTVDYLVVAGGGGGSYGGGGAGGLRSTVTATGGGGSLESALSLTAGTSYTVTVGAGGAKGSAGNSYIGQNGSNSVFSTITSTGGGGAAYDTPSTGGSGGGRGNTGVGAAGTANQGYAGGAGTSGGREAGGGGGAGAVGASGVGGTDTGGAGGNGVAVSITGSSVTYAGGGGGGGQTTGGAGGTGGGATGTASTPAANATVNSGGGGGGSYGSAVDFSNGGSGIVIIRYLA